MPFFFLVSFLGLFCSDTKWKQFFFWFGVEDEWLYGYSTEGLQEPGWFPDLVLTKPPLPDDDVEEEVEEEADAGGAWGVGLGFGGCLGLGLGFGGYGEGVWGVWGGGFGAWVGFGGFGGFGLGGGLRPRLPVLEEAKLFF